MAQRNSKLKIAIVSDGRTQRQLAADTGIKENRLSNLVAGVTIARPTERAALACELSKTESELFELGDSTNTASAPAGAVAR